MQHHQLRRWRARHRWSLAQAAARLGLSPRTLANYERGRRHVRAGVVGPAPIPRAVALACLALEALPEVEDYDGSALAERDTSSRAAARTRRSTAPARPPPTSW